MLIVFDYCNDSEIGRATMWRFLWMHTIRYDTIISFRVKHYFIWNIVLPILKYWKKLFSQKKVLFYFLITLSMTNHTSIVKYYFQESELFPLIYFLKCLPGGWISAFVDAEEVVFYASWLWKIPAMVEQLLCLWIYGTQNIQVTGMKQFVSPI